MVELDGIFTKSNLDKNKKNSKMIFGKLLIKLRKNNKIKLYSLLESVIDTDMDVSVIKLIVKDKSTYDMLNNPTDIGILNSSLDEIANGLRLELVCCEKNEFDTQKFETFLKNEFGKILTIKKD